MAAGEDRPVKITCPSCGERFELDRLLEGQVERRYAWLLGRFGPAQLALVMGFLNCFRRPGGRLSVSRRASLLEEVWGLIDQGELVFDRRRYRVSREDVLAALDATRRAKELKGLTGLNYFKRILAGLADRAEASAERTREERLRAGRREEEPAERPADPVQVKEGLDRILRRTRTT